MVRTVKFEEMQTYHFYHMESKASLVKTMSESSGHVVRTCKIMDLSGLGRQHLDRRGLVYFKKLIDLSQGAYPEMLGDLYIVNTPVGAQRSVIECNAGRTLRCADAELMSRAAVSVLVLSQWIFGMGWKLVSPWLNDETKSKIHILPNDKYQKLLQDVIDPKHIPAFLGGTCTCAGVQEGGCVPLRDPDAGMTSVSIGGRGKHEHKFRVDAADFERLRKEAEASEAQQTAEGEAAPAAAAEPGAAGAFRGVLVRYDFRTVKNDIAFEIRTRALAGPVYAPPTAASAAAAAASTATAPASAASLPQQSESSSWVVLQASARYSSDQEPVSSSFVLSAPCEVSLLFDNAFSMFTGKTVKFRVELDAQLDRTQDEEETKLSEAIAAADTAPAAAETQ